MKKIDLHVHTKASISDSYFEFNIEKLKEYVNELNLDAIAITNHNLFDREQFEDIQSNIDICVLPGVEVDLEKGHMLVIVPYEKIDDFEKQCNNLSNDIKTANDYITYERFIELFPNYNEYLLIPHYIKKPSINNETIEKFQSNIFCGEVENAKKWSVEKKKENSLVPLLFSDIRIKEDIDTFPNRATYLEINDINISSLKLTLKDKTKVHIAESKNDEEFPIDKTGLLASTKLNIIIGNRSSGKTYTLEKIKKSFKDGNIKYIKQFELTTNCGENKFDEIVKADYNSISEDYLLPLKNVVSKVLSIDIENDELKCIEYQNSLIENAINTEKNDIFSKTKLFSEILFDNVQEEETKKLIESIKSLLESEKYKDLIKDNISIEGLVNLLEIFIGLNRKEELSNKLKNSTDEIVTIIKRMLGKKSALTPIKDIDFYQIYKNKVIVEKFENLIASLKLEKEIYTKDFNGYKIKVKRKAFKNATDLKNELKEKMSLKDIFDNYYESPYNYINELKNNGIEEESIYKTLIKIEYEVLNSRDLKISGGERAEFNLLKELIDAEKYDVLLIDEPESSFDNPFIKSNIIQILKDLAEKTTVFIVTHNNTLGTLIKPNRILYTQHIDELNEFTVYSGNFSDKELKDCKKRKIKNYSVLMENMEAGETAYQERKEIYEDLKN